MYESKLCVLYEDYYLEKVSIFWLSSILIAALFPFASVVSAANLPQSLSPSGGQEVSDTSPKLSWQYTDSCPLSGSCFLVEVDDSGSFDSPNKSVYTNNTYYSPQDLNEGEWFWRVKAKDVSSSWSDWSSTNFKIIASAGPSPSASASSEPSPSVVPVSGSTSNTSQFNVSGVPSAVNSSESFAVVVSLSLPSNPSTNFYLKGAFQKNGSSNYFGQTQVSGSWIKNGDSYAQQFRITTDGSGNWSGNLQVMPDNEDSGYVGTGDYIFKVGRYSASGSGPTWSNEANIQINGVVPTATPKASSTPTPKSTVSPKTSVISPSPSSKNSTTVNGSLVSSYQNSGNGEDVKIASIAGIAVQSDTNSEAGIVNESKFNWYFIASGLVLLLTTSALIVKKIKTGYYFNYDFKERFSKRN